MGLAVLVILMLGLQAVQGRYGCPSSGFNEVKYYKDKCYGFATRWKYRATYPDAKKKCKNSGGILAMPKTKDVNSFIAKHLGSEIENRAWIGLNDRREETVFRWEDDTRLGGFHAFQNGEGHKGKTHFGHLWEDCVALDNKGTWHDYACTRVAFSLEEHYYICEYNMPPTTTSTTTPTPTTTTPKTTTTTPTTTTPSPTTTTPTTTTPSPTTTTTPTTTTPSPTTTTTTTTTPPPVTTPTTPATTTTPTPAVTATSTVAVTTTTECPVLNCNTDCGLLGQKTNSTTGCFLCECDIE